MTSIEETKEEKAPDTEKIESEIEGTSNGLEDKQNGETIEGEDDEIPQEKENTAENADATEKVENTPVDSNKNETEVIETKPNSPTRASKRKLTEIESEGSGDVSKSDITEEVKIKTEENPDDDSGGFQGFPTTPLPLSFDTHFMDTSSNDKDNPPKSIPESDIMGKGKRARIPNKRYSEIALTNSRKSLGAGKSSDMDATEEVIIKEEPLDEPSISSPPLSQPPAPKKSRTSSAGPDLQDPKYLKPFKYGWRRELVWRGTSSNEKRMGDIYYYTPTGKKARSMREVSELIDNRLLTLDNFTYTKVSLGVNDTSKETIRHAKPINQSKSDSPAVKANLKTTAVKNTGSPLVKNVVKAAAKKVMSPKLNSPKVLSPRIASAKVETPKSPARIKKEKETPSSNTPGKKKKVVLIKKPPLRTADSGKTPAKDSTPKSTPAAKEKEAAKTPSNATKPGRKGRSAATPTPKTDESMEVDSSPPPVRLSPLKTKIARINNFNKKKNLRGRKANPLTNSNSTNHFDDKPEAKFMENYLQNLSFGYNTLLYVFQYLKVQDLLRAGCVCTMWRDIASHPILWKTVRMKNSQVHSFEGLANTLKSHGTVNLDLRKMLLPNNGDEIWPEFSKAIEKVDTLRKIELCRCPASVVERLAVTNPKLEVINAVTIKCEVMELDTLENLISIKELRLKATNGLNISSIGALRELKTLKVLSLTSVNELHRLNLNVLGELTNLEQLDLGECTEFPKNFGKDILSKLKNLERLRLEKGQGVCHTFDILDAVKNMPKLEQLELVNFDVKSGFDKALGACTNIKKLMIIPTYISQSATTNNMVLSGVLRLQGSLSHFVWGVTLELLRVTELFVDQCEEPKEKKEKKPTGNGDSIPVLKPVPDLTHSKEIPVACNPPQVEILPLPNLQKLLLNSLPTTRVKILKIPFHATWRQTLTDSV